MLFFFEIIVKLGRYGIQLQSILLHSLQKSTTSLLLRVTSLSQFSWDFPGFGTGSPSKTPITSNVPIVVTNIEGQNERKRNIRITATPIGIIQNSPKMEESLLRDCGSYRNEPNIRGPN